MERNPYSPPAATVRDPNISVPPKPLEVARACWVLWAVFVISLVTLHPSIRGDWWSIPDVEDGETIGMVFGIVLAVVFFILYAVLVIFIGRRHNWARWALLTYAVAGWFITVSDFPRSLSETPIAAAMDGLMTLAEAWAFYLLFFGPGAQWFRAR